VAELESALGAWLLHRTTRHVTPSDDGREYYERARQILSDLEDAEALVTGARRSAHGRLRVAMPMALARAFVVPALPRFLAAHPELALEIRLENRSLALLEDGVDCALSYGKPADDSLIAQRVTATHLLTCAAPTYLARRGTPRTPDDLSGHACVPFLSLDTARPAPWTFLDCGATRELRPEGSLAFNSMEACVEAAVAGLGITQVVSSIAAPALKARRLRAVLTEHAAPGPSIYVVYPPQRRASVRLRALLDFLREVFERRTG
jgi:LysR family transcriptional regulator for bpeEF and oprC